jgi:hypothetical protein
MCPTAECRIDLIGERGLKEGYRNKTKRNGLLLFLGKYPQVSLPIRLHRANCIQRHSALSLLQQVTVIDTLFGLLEKCSKHFLINKKLSDVCGSMHTITTKTTHNSKQCLLTGSAVEWSVFIETRPRCQQALTHYMFSPLKVCYSSMWSQMIGHWSMKSPMLCIFFVRIDLNHLFRYG